MTVRVYRSTDASAPTLTGQVGSLTALLDAVLVNGYGAQTAAGWTINQTTTNKRGYKQNTHRREQHEPACCSTSTTPDLAPAVRKEARAAASRRCRRSRRPAPVSSRPRRSRRSAPGTLVIRKSATADATARAWTIIATGQTIYMFIESGDNVAPALGCTTFCFGDFKSYKSADQYAVMIIARATENNAGTQCDPLHAMQLSNGGALQVLNTTMFGHFIARHWTGVGGAVRFGKPSPHSYIATSFTSTVVGQVESHPSVAFSERP
jgi:hypothetical protein